MRRNSVVKLMLTVVSLFEISNLYAATSQDVQFSGNMPNSCTVVSDTNGVLGFNGSNVLETDQTGGSRGQVTINCLTTGTVSLSAINTGAVSTAATTAGFNSNWGAELLEGSTVKAHYNELNSGNLNSQAFNGTAKVYSLKAWVYHTPNFTYGTYTYRVTTTVTAN